MGLEEDCYWAVPAHWGTAARSVQYEPATVKDFYLRAGKGDYSSSGESLSIQTPPQQTALSLMDSDAASVFSGFEVSGLVTGLVCAILVAFFAGRRFERKRTFQELS